MFTRLRSAIAKNGKGAEALRWVQDVAAYQNGKDPDLRAEVHREVFGDALRIHYVTHHDDLAAYERWVAAANADAELQRILAKNPDVMVEGSYRDLLLRSAER